MEPVTLSANQFDQLYTSISTLLDKVSLDGYDAGVETLTRLLVILDNAQYGDDEALEYDAGDDPQQELDFEE
jgi:hypothetical protein